MRVSVLSVLAAASVVSAQSTTTPAPQVTSNPAGASYGGTLPAKPGSTLRGTITGATAPGGVKFAVSISGLPETGGPFIYHIHEKPVPADGNCTGTGAHLDPYKRGETPPCDKSNPATCQVGDLSGKWGNITATTFSATYTDPYLSTDPASNAFFGNLAFVVHLSNKTRIGCANFSMLGGSAAPTGYMPGNTTVPSLPAGPSATSYVPPPAYTGGAAKIAGSAGLLAAALALVL